jgi:beta-galactosidase
MYHKKPQPLQAAVFLYHYKRVKLIEFDINGSGKILGVGNGDPSSHEPDKYISNWKRKLFSGCAQIIIQATDEPGEISLAAKSKGLEGTTLVVKSKVGIKKPAI